MARAGLSFFKRITVTSSVDAPPVPRETRASGIPGIQAFE